MPTSVGVSIGRGRLMGKTGVVRLARVDDYFSFGNSGIKPVFSGFWGGPTFGVGLGGWWRREMIQMMVVRIRG